ncbi:MAG TPA: glycosyltransferase family 4 protein [Actinomycetota bacterium]|nr:glycosyltransferase family 4 protein [Actinomycetota bacterium]
MRIAVLHPQTAFARGGAEVHTEALIRALREQGHEAEQVTIAGKWYPATELAHQMAVWRSFDITESGGLEVDAVIGLKFPAYLAQHERKIVWLIHQHRTAYELWDHPQFADLAHQDEGPAVRDMVRAADTLALTEAKRVFANSKNVRDRLMNSLSLQSDVLYHRSPISEALLEQPPLEIEDHVLYPGRFESLKRQSLAIDAMRHVKTPVRLVLVGSGPDEAALRERAEDRAVRDRVRIEGRVPDERLHQLYRSALGILYTPFDEDYGYVTIEGYAASRPVVTVTDSGGPLEFVTEGETGLVAEPDPKAIAEALDRLYTDRETATRWGVAGNNLVREVVPAWPEVVTKLLT